MRKWRHGDVLIEEVEKIEGEKVDNLILAYGEVTGHKHQISKGLAELFESGDTKYLHVKSKKASLTHEEHKEIVLPQGFYKIIIQREHTPEGWKNVQD